jgi:hypothetical protein
VSFGPARSLWEEQPSLRELYDQACAGLVRAECEVEELRAEVALLLEERNILGTASLSKALRGTTVTKAAVTEGAEPSCNDSAQAFRERPEPSPHLSDTPETEAHSPWRYAINANGVTTHYVPADFARKLERERDEAQKDLAELCARYNELIGVKEPKWYNGREIPADIREETK